jgi:phosphomannomutase
MLCKKHVFKTKIIKEYDIRGEFRKDLTESDAYFLGCGLGTYIKNRNIQSKICVGYDGRKSSPKLKSSLIEGFLDVGLDVLDLGLITTPILYYACHIISHCSCGVMVTASHNPPKFNGFKIIVDKKPLFGKSLMEICNIAKNEGILFPKTRGLFKEININQEYIDKITNPITHFSKSEFDCRLKIAWDICNSSLAKILKMIIKKLPGEHILVNENAKDRYVDPTNEQNLSGLKTIMKKQRCDFGIALDGDADRIVLINGNYRVVFGDELLAFFARDLLKRHFKPKIIADIKASKTLVDKINNEGAEIILYKTGHANIKNKMVKEGALLAGEVSGHMFFKENYFGFDDALFASCKLTYLFLAEKNREYFNNLPKIFVSPEIKIKCEDSHKILTINRIKNLLNSKKISYNDMDGIRVECERGWWLIRCSNTEDSLIMRFEGYSQDNFHFILTHLSNILRSIGINNFFN